MLKVNSRLLRFILLAHVYFLIFACNNKTSENANILANTSKDSINPVRPDTNNIKVNAEFPFGSIALARYTYPHYWKENENYNETKSKETKELEEISTILHAINNAKVIPPPKTRSIEFIDLNQKYKDDSYYFDTLAVRETDSCIFRLPDIKNFQCYYFRQITKKRTYGDYGSLLLIDNKTNIGNLLTVYFEYGREQNVSLRYYYVSNDTIHLYDGYCYDDGTTLKESFKITVNETNKIQVINSGK